MKVNRGVTLTGVSPQSCVDVFSKRMGMHFPGWRKDTTRAGMRWKVGAVLIGNFGIMLTCLAGDVLDEAGALGIYVLGCAV